MAKLQKSVLGNRVLGVLDHFEKLIGLRSNSILGL